MMRVLTVLGIVALLLTGCASASSAPDVQANGEDGLSPRSFVLPTKRGTWTPPKEAYVSQKPTGKGRVHIAGIGQFTFDASEVKTQRPDIFLPGHFSVFDTLVHTAQEGEITLDYHFDRAMDTHVIDAINGETGWWYDAYYASGWSENNVFRMDVFPYKNGTHIRLFKETSDHLAGIHSTFTEEVARLEGNGGQVVIPELTIRSPRANYAFRDVVVEAGLGIPVVGGDIEIVDVQFQGPI